MLLFVGPYLVLPIKGEIILIMGANFNWLSVCLAYHYQQSSSDTDAADDIKLQISG